jgi:hypothetical protein
MKSDTNPYATSPLWSQTESIREPARSSPPWRSKLASVSTGVACGVLFQVVSSVIESITHVFQGLLFPASVFAVMGAILTFLRFHPAWTYIGILVGFVFVLLPWYANDVLFPLNAGYRIVLTVWTWIGIAIAWLLKLGIGRMYR